MCGFVGVLRPHAAHSKGHDGTLAKMSALLSHRGPDAADVHWDGPCGLAHRRLSIIDLSGAGRQPMSNEDGTVWIAYNGEIYNFQDLRRQFALDEKGHQFRSRTDTEVIIHMYEEIGIDVIKYLNGMFAFALWDKKTQTLYLARDSYGIKPLFYTRTKQGFWFASEIKALLAVPDYTPRPNLEGLYHFLGFGYVPGNLTAFEDITELRPGHVLKLRVGSGEPDIKRFYGAVYEIKDEMTEDDALHDSLDLLTQAVKRQLIADVPVGVMLSGGMDSSALTALMAKVRGAADFHTFSLAFEDASFNEAPYAKMVAEHVGTTHHEILVTVDKVRDLLPTYLAYIDEPYADGSAIPTYLLAQTAKEHITVLLSGEGGDEFYSGYDTHAAYKMRHLFRRIPEFIRRQVIHRSIDMLPVSHKKLSLEFKAKRFVRGAELDVPTSHFFWRMVLSEDAKAEILYKPERFNGFHASSQFFIDAFQHCHADDDLNRLLYIDFSFHLPDDLMIKNDRMTMAHSLEARVPFTDNELVQFLATVPIHYKMKGLHKKHLLRTSCQGLLPDKVLAKKKVGLEMPYSKWLLTGLRDMTETAFAEAKLKTTGLFNTREVQKMWQEHKARQVDHGRALWSLLNYMLWHEMYIEKRNFASYLLTPRAARILE